jgi:hypothetical protein
MAVSRALRRLLRIRNLEEQQSRMEFESALGELGLLERALAQEKAREIRGRRLVETGIRGGLVDERLAGLEESRAGERHARVLNARVVTAQDELSNLREELLERRVARRQAETLIEEAEFLEAMEAGRRGQQGIDDWYGARRQRQAKNETATYGNGPKSIERRDP